MASYLGNGFYLPSSGMLTVPISNSIIVIDPMRAASDPSPATRASVSRGPIAVDSTSTSAISASGNAQLNASVIDVVGGFKKSGNADFNPRRRAASPSSTRWPGSQRRASPA